MPTALNSQFVKGSECELSVFGIFSSGWGAEHEQEFGIGTIDNLTLKT